MDTYSIDFTVGQVSHRIRHDNSFERNQLQSNHLGYLIIIVASNEILILQYCNILGIRSIKRCLI